PPTHFHDCKIPHLSNTSEHLIVGKIKAGRCKV
ncbi:MAG: hypothetical protein ACI9JY_001535, partial [Saprospiraceae bacterium]